MRLWSVAFLIGIVVLQQFTQLPNYYLLLAIPALIFSYWRYTRLPAACILGFVWALYFAQLQLAARLPSELEGVTIPITGYIASIPTPVEHGTAFVFHLENLNNHPTHGNLRLMWTNMKVTLHAGDEWRFYARLKKPYGTMNPGGFDYEAYALQASIDGNGYIDDKEKNQLLTSHWYRYSMTRLRQLLQQKISQHLPQSKTSAWISALAIGERNDIAGEDWQVLRNTGTNHLMAIAGLHIGFLALVAHFLVAALWRRIPYLCNKLPAVHAGAMAALLMAFVYSAMAGFSLPSQRACCMLAIFLMTLLFRKNIAAWQAWSGALLCVLILNPLSVLTESFWLSFASVALIIYGVGGRLAPTGLWWKLGRIQWVIAVGLVPFSIWLFKQCSLISFVANSIAIPWVGFLVAPLSFFGAMTLLISTTLGSWILIFADKMLGILWILLSWLAHLPNVVWYQNVAHTWMLWAGVVAMIFLLLPAGFPGRYFSIVWMLPLLLFKPPTPDLNTAWFTLLDVGQGLAAVVQTQKHTLIFDTGPRLSASYDMGDSVVVPFLHSINAHQVDMLVVSHKDNDHSGGAHAILQQFPVATIKTSVPELFPKAKYCLQGEKWVWDGVTFEFLSPTKELLGLDNNSSCVLRVTIGNKHILFTGDIEKLAEKSLVENQLENLPSTILIAPHHGSKTSANEKFIRGINPQVVLFPVGYRNRYHFPNVSVVKKYKDLNVVQYETDKAGAIKFVLQSGVEMVNPELYRINHKYYWNN